jgi:hypothetical protein
MDEAFVKLSVDSPGLEKTYFRTRHKHLRCFPQCLNGKHNEKAFCGDSIVVTVSSLRSSSLALEPKNIDVYLEFRTVTESKSALNIGDRVANPALRERTIQATFVMEKDNMLRFAFNPPRKWEYRGRINKGERHMFSIYCVAHGSVVGRFLSGQFQIAAIDTKKTTIPNKGKPEDASSSTNDIDSTGVTKQATQSSNIELVLPVNAPEGAAEVVLSACERHQEHKRAKPSNAKVETSRPLCNATATIETANQQVAPGVKSMLCFSTLTAVVNPSFALSYAPGYLGSGLVNPLRVGTFQISSPMALSGPPVQQQFRDPILVRTANPTIRLQNYASYHYLA